MANRFVNPVAQFLNNAGESLAGAKLFFFASGTSTPLATFSDTDLITPNLNPVICDGAGRIPNIFMQQRLYKVVMMTANDVLIWERDPFDGSTASGGGTVQTALTYAALDALPTGAAGIYYTAGRLATGDGGEGFWYETTTSSLTDDGGSRRTASDTNSVRVRLFDGKNYDARWFGIIGDHTPATPGSGTDNTAIINSSMNLISANITQNATNIGFLNAAVFFMPVMSGARQNFVRHLNTLTVPKGIRWNFLCPTYAEKVNVFEPAIDFLQGSHLEYSIAWVNSGSGFRFGGAAVANEMVIEFFKINNVGETATGTTPFVDQQIGCQFRGFNFFVGTAEVVGGNIGFDYQQVSDVGHGGKLLAVSSSTGFRITSGCEHITNFNWVADSCNFLSGQIDSSNNINGFAEAFFNESAFPAEDNNQSGFAFLIGQFSVGNPVTQCNIDFQISNTDGVGVKFFTLEDCQFSVSVSNALETTSTMPTKFNVERDAAFTVARQEKTAISLYGSPLTGFWQTTLGRPTNVSPLWENGTLFTSGNISVAGTAAIWTSGTGTPEGVVTAVVGSLFTRTDGGASTTLYVKESGAGNTGWAGV